MADFGTVTLITSVACCVCQVLDFYSIRTTEKLEGLAQAPEGTICSFRTSGLCHEQARTAAGKSSKGLGISHHMSSWDLG